MAKMNMLVKIEKVLILYYVLFVKMRCVGFAFVEIFLSYCNRKTICFFENE